MKRFLFIIFSLLFVCSPVFAANNFASDSHCKAVFLFETLTREELTDDDTLLTNYNTVTQSSTHKEGSYSAAFASGSSQALYSTDANIALTISDFPLLNGDSQKIISVTFWVRFTTLTGGHYVFGKWDSIGNKRSFAFGDISTDQKLYILLGYNGGSSFEQIPSGTGLFSNKSFSTNTWYHFGLTYRDDTKAWTARLYTDGGSTENDSGTATNNINIEDGLFTLGSLSSSGTPASFHNGLIDEFAVFDDILSDDEIDDIRNGVYDVSGGGTGTSILLTGAGQ